MELKKQETYFKVYYYYLYKIILKILEIKEK